MSRILIAGTFLLAAFVTAPRGAAAQSLAALADQAASRTGAAQKTYTNADLEAVTTPAAQPASLPAAEAPAAPTPAPEESPAPRGPVVEEVPGAGRVNLVVKPEKNSSAENEPYWRKVTKSVKDRLARAEADLAMIAARLETADERERAKLTELQAQRQRDLEFVNAEYAGHKKRAQALGVPQEWLR